LNTTDTAEKIRKTNTAFVDVLIEIERDHGVPTETCERLLELYQLSGSLIVRRVEEIVTASAGGEL
jgi:hypothetical protein